MVEPYFCERCHFGTGEPVGACPRCGRAMRKTSTVRALGWVLVVLGGSLAAFMAWLALFVRRLIAQSDEPGAKARFTGDASDAVFIYAIFGLVLALGLAFMAGGVWQIVYGRRNKSIIFVVLVLVALLYGLGLFVRGLD